MPDFTELQDINAQKASVALTDARHKESLAYMATVADVTLSATTSLISYLEGHISKTEVVNQLESISTPDVKYVVEALNVLDNTLKSRPVTDLTEITDVMNKVLAEASAIPKELPVIPEHKPIDYTTQLNTLSKAIDAVTAAVKAQELHVEAPVINVPKTKVDVAAPNLDPIDKGLKAVERAVKAIAIPEAPEFDTSDLRKELKQANKTLDKLLSKPVGGGGGSTSSWPAIGTNGIPIPLNLDASGNLKTTANVNLNGSDIEIGAVEIKDGTTDDRTSVINTDPTTQYGLVTRNIPSGIQLVGIDNTKSVKYYAQVLTATTTLTPTAGKAIKLVKMQVLQNPDNSSANQVTLGFVSTGNFFTGWVGSDNAEVTGATNEVLNITLGNAQQVSVLLRFKEI